MKKALFALATTAMLTLGSVGANATPITVGGVTWDPDATNVYPSQIDFSAHGGVTENAVTPIPGSVVTGFGKITQMNSAEPNSFCAGCELTYWFSMELVSITPTSLTGATFAFGNVQAWLMVDSTPNYNATLASAQDGDIWLQLAGSGNLTGSGSNIGTGSDSGTGFVFLDVVAGLAMSNFDTNEFLNGSDMLFNSSFSPVSSNPGFLQGTADLTGNSIPEPASLALVGLGLLGVAAARRRKQAK